jgi:hypothetical protein
MPPVSRRVADGLSSGFIGLPPFQVESHALHFEVREWWTERALPTVTASHLGRKRRASACSLPNSLYLQAILLALPIPLAP